MKKLLIPILFALCAINISIAKEQIIVSISGTDIDEPLKKVFGSKLVSAITQSDNYTAFERSDDFLDAITIENLFQGSGEVDKEQIFEYGKKTAAKYVAAIDITELFGEFFVASRLMELESAKIVASYDSSGPVNSMQELTSLADNIADGLILGPERAKKAEENARIKAQNEKAENDRLRQMAIDNLVPSGCQIVGKYIVKSTLVPVNIILEKTYVTCSVNIGYGFDMANAEILSYLWNNGFSSYMLDYRLIVNKRITNNKNYKEYLCGWEMTVFRNGFTSIFEIATTEWSGGRLKEYFSFPLYAIAYSLAPSESQIKAEMARLKSYR